MRRILLHSFYKSTSSNNLTLDPLYYFSVNTISPFLFIILRIPLPFSPPTLSMILNKTSRIKRKNQTIFLHVEPSYTFAQVKARISEMHRIETDRIMLFASDKVSLLNTVGVASTEKLNKYTYTYTNIF